MRKIKIEFNVYKLNELTGINYRNAIDEISRARAEEWQEFDAEELLTSMRKAAEHFGMRVIDSSVNLFDSSHVLVDREGFDDEQAEHASQWINERYEDGVNGHCPFTGVHFDCYFFDVFKAQGGAKPETVKQDIVRAITFMLEECVNNAEQSINDDEDSLEYADMHELEFYDDGRIYNG
ncbi:hypothetical protein [Bacillus sp. 7894-2]|uniref:hypothetical protein n=1 Tax=Bacillus sp. 7894-2 TaxID=2021695 RepID=UPI000BA6E4E8|nr:hypothetical protein [Bacillus sp. 7894-2]PAE24057.1 hypothetical protein CHI10_14740 [Bacillus sp. 7894-2]